ncbi:MAG: helix-turn-helix domain-containing protein [Thomasclavelia sp.]|uniref:helix-turn-helix domain-containing protein n=1 Tax=Thomasclavelia sp. TaxID=3025757 RepID=UPI0039A04B20
MNKFIYEGDYINKTNHHIYISPAKQLKDIIAHYTITFPNEVPASSEMYHIIPDASGCFIFQGEERRDFWGAMSEIVILKNDLQKAQPRFFIEFKPGGLYQISGLIQKNFVNRREKLVNFNFKIDQDLNNIYQTCNDYQQLIDSFNEYFIQHRKKYPLPNRFIKAKEIIDKNKGVVNLENIANDCNISSRQLLRDFHTYLGLSGKEYAKVVRFNCLLKQLKNDNFVSVALQGGYFDQAHFNKVFKQITKTTPKNYLLNLSDFYNEIYKF